MQHSQPSQPSRTPWIALGIGLVSLVVIGMIGAGFGFFYYLRAHGRSHAYAGGLGTSTSTSSAPGWSDLDSPVPISSDDPTWGERDAPVTIVVFADFEDPFAARLVPTLDSLKTLYGEPKLRIAWKHHALPYHPHARTAAETGAGIYMMGGNVAFWHFEERAYANQKSLDSASFDVWATESGIDLTRLHDGMARHDWAPKVDADERVATGLGVLGSPVSYVNGTKVSGAQPVATWQTAIDDELPKAQAAIASGVSGDRVYVTRSKINFGATGLPSPSATTTYAPPTASLTVHNVPVGTSPVRGRSDALVTLVEFGDFQCPYCGKAEATLTALRAKYGADLRIVWKNNPLSFHTHALPAAEVALEARDEKGDAMFWSMHDELYASQANLENAQLLVIARTHGLDETRVLRALSMHPHQTKIDIDATLAKRVGATGTPTFFINGRMLSGAQPQTTFEALIDDELAKAKTLVAKGTPRTRVYDETIATATD